MNHTLNAYGECVHAVVEEKAQGRGVLNIPGMLAINLIKYAIHKITGCLAQEISFWNWVLWIIAHGRAVAAEKDEPRRH